MHNPLKPSEHARLLLISSSFSNLSLLPMWMHHESDYLEPLPYAELAAIVLGTSLCLYLAALALRNHWHNRALQALALIAFLVLPLDGIRQALGLSAGSLARTFPGVPSGLFRWGMLAILLVLAIAWLRGQQRFMVALGHMLLILSPLLLFSATLVITRTGSLSAPYYHYAGITHEAPRKVLRPVFVLVFDEADYGLIFGNRPAGLSLPTFDRLADHSVNFTRAYSPGRDTVLALPALLMGERLKHVTANGQALAVTSVSGQVWPDWRTGDHLINPRNSPARRTAVIGFYHPYCAITGLAYCSHHRVYPYRRWAFELMPAPLAALQSNILFKRALKPYLPRAARLSAEKHQKMFEDIGGEILNLPTGYDLVFGHINMPHPTGVPVPAIRRFGKLTRADYFRNLTRTDGFLRRFIDDVSRRHAGTQPIIIVTSDHGLRYASWAGIGYDVSEFTELASRDPLEDFHVPFLVHFPAAAHGMRIERPVNNLHIRALVEAVFAGTVRGEDDVARFLAAKPFISPLTDAKTFAH